ncbi:peptidoglycan-binding protein [Oceanobacillus sojae]|uniref:peptidoglycan-binding protein n=1 Tax=Oceanobacillus sojae TaxID=582851 RepID=UPI0009886DC4|nr:peptidoglycan-binding protein [Oceanobacillus sojae]
MRNKWIPLLVIALLIISPFSTASEVYAMSNNQSKESQQSDEHTEEDDNNRIDTEQEASTNEAESEEVVFQLGDEEEAIQELKEDLTELGFAALENPTEYFGLHTEESVKVFQAFHYIEETGIADEETLQMIEDMLLEDSFDREAHLEFSKPEEFVTDEKEVEQDSEAEIEESAESEEGQNSEAEEDVESEESQESEKEEDIESEGEQESETEEGTESEREQESETEEDTESVEEQESETEEGTESEREQESETEEDTESVEEQESETEEIPESEEVQESETEENLESEEDQESEIEEHTEEQQVKKQSLAKVETFAAKSTYQQGDRHADIVKYKKQLNTVGFGYITETNLFGSFMKTQIKRFQEYYGLNVTGKIDAATKNKLNSVYNSPYQKGKRHNDMKEIKEKLNNLGYGYISITTLYGSFMDKKVREFQRDHGLRVNGIVDEVTLAKLDQLAPKNTYQQGDRHADIVKYKKQLNTVGFGYITETNLFGSFMKTQIKRFQEYYGLNVTGKIDAATKNKLNNVYNSPYQKGKRHNDMKEIKEKLNNLGYGYISITTLYGSFMDKKVREFQRDHGLRVNGIVDEVTLAKLDQLAPKNTYQQGDRHADIVKYKKQLNTVGFGYITETNLFGSFMKTQVKRFQEYYGLNVTGKIDAATKNKLNSVYNSPYQKGKHHNHTAEIKKKLNSLGYGYISITTLYGDFMERKVKEFQRDHGLRANGIIDEITLSQINQAFNQQSSVKIFLDPGHGGSDPGGTGYGLKEKDVVLDIALKTEQVLTTKYKDVEVELSRRNDTFIELTERANHANRWGADYFVSLHNNAFNGSTRGFESFIHNGNVSQEIKNRQQDIHSYLSGRLNVPDRGQKTANFSVLRNTNMPSILIEYLFIDNFTENALLKNENYRQQLAQYTADAIAQSYNLKRK